MSELAELRARLDALEGKGTKEEIQLSDEFDGVFRFSNNSDEDFIGFWNSKEYLIPARSRSPMILANQSLEEIQAIRKRWAFKWAEREWYKGDQYKKMKEMGNGLPPIRQDKDLEPLIQMCLEPLPIVKADVREGKEEKMSVSEHTAAVGDTDNLNEVFKDVTKPEKIRKLGKQSTSFNA